MKQILESMLDELEWLSKNASNWEYYLGKYDLCKELLSQCNEMICSSQDLYYDDADEFYSCPIEDYYSDLAMYKQEEINDMYNKHYHYSWWIGKNVLHTDSMWFTSDEIEAFREIWQRRLSA
tara:strand:- start:531 stop:896 length:366 start_codon:yes stop_codon:yes gene_type:complete